MLTLKFERIVTQSQNAAHVAGRRFKNAKQKV